MVVKNDAYVRFGSVDGLEEVALERLIRKRREVEALDALLTLELTPASRVIRQATFEEEDAVLPLSHVSHTVDELLVQPMG